MNMTKIKAAVRYQISETIEAMGIYYACFFGCTLAVVILISSLTGETAGSTTSEISSMIFLAFITGIAARIYFRFFIQNGMTRKECFLSFSLGLAGISLIMSLFETVIGTLLRPVFGMSLFEMTYDGLGAFHKIPWVFALYLATCAVTYLMVMLKTRMGTKPFLFLMLALSLIVFLILPALNAVMNNVIMTAISQLLVTLMGFETGSILPPVCTFLVLSILSMLGGYFLTKRAEV